MATQTDETRLQEAMSDILHEASKTHNQIYKLNTDAGKFVKVKRSYAEPEDFRILYLAALDGMLQNGTAHLRLKNKDLEMYEIVPTGHAQRHYLEEIKQKLYKEAAEFGILYKVYSATGDFVQCGDIFYAKIDDERIVYLEALGDFLRHGLIQLISESHELSTYEIVKEKESTTFGH